MLKKLLASTGIAGIVLLTGSHSALAAVGTVTGSRASGQTTQAQPRDPRLNAPGLATHREQALQTSVLAEPGNVANWLELARLQEARRATAAAERTFKAALEATAGAREVFMAMVAFYGRTGQFDKAIAALEEAAAKNPGDPLGYQIIAVHYFEKLQKDHSLAPADRLTYIDAGVAATDRALAAKDDYVDALVYKNLLLRVKSNMEVDPLRREAWIAEADALRNRAIELNKTRGQSGGTPGSPEAPTPPPPPGTYEVDGQQAIRVGRDIKTPVKIADVRPVYPQDALDARISGMVILEAVIDAQGSVRSVRVLKSVPALDQAASDAVKQWRFTPTLLNGVAVPVIMTVTVSFTVQ